ncbi:hypothetical protein ELI_4222 [Eubacterium callanderi]|uniref:Uncharacterized protein n=1 Tax=Eubacterium callanderi TaxID=53442 RepID=E3GQB5_9FIRM|nr:hypothetical protein ELI_4222 [Eubacterium callanderi]
MLSFCPQNVSLFIVARYNNQYSLTIIDHFGKINNMLQKLDSLNLSQKAVRCNHSKKHTALRKA